MVLVQVRVSTTVVLTMDTSLSLVSILFLRIWDSVRD